MASKRSRARGFRGLMNQFATLAHSEDARAQVPRRRRELQPRRDRVRALLRVRRAGSECPPLRKAFATGQLSWVQAQALVPLMLEPAATRHRAAWVRHAARVSVRRGRARHA